LLAGYAWVGVGPTATWLGAGAMTFAALAVVWRFVAFPSPVVVPEQARVPLQ